MSWMVLKLRTSVAHMTPLSVWKSMPESGRRYLWYIYLTREPYKSISKKGSQPKRKMGKTLEQMLKSRSSLVGQ